MFAVCGLVVSCLIKDIFLHYHFFRILYLVKVLFYKIPYIIIKIDCKIRWLYIIIKTLLFKYFKINTYFVGTNKKSEQALNVKSYNKFRFNKIVYT